MHGKIPETLQRCSWGSVACIVMITLLEDVGKVENFVVVEN